jgi:hypothetical protein
MNSSRTILTWNSKNADITVFGSRDSCSRLSRHMELRCRVTLPCFIIELKMIHFKCYVNIFLIEGKVLQDR